MKVSYYIWAIILSENGGLGPLESSGTTMQTSIRLHWQILSNSVVILIKVSLRIQKLSLG